MWTWLSPNRKIKNKIDHLLINDLAIVNNKNTVAKFDFFSDHRITRCTIKIPDKNKKLHQKCLTKQKAIPTDKTKEPGTDKGTYNLGKNITDRKNILTTATKYYRKFYSTNISKINTDNKNTNEIGNIEEAPPIMEEEVRSVINKKR